MPDSFHENVVVITGASSGIGRSLALNLAGEGAWLVLAARTEDWLQAVAGECRAVGGRALVVPTDVRNEDQCHDMLHRAVEHYGRIDTLVNNAGYSMRARLEDLTTTQIIEDIVATNLMGSVYCTYHALDALKASQGRIVAVSSLNGKTGVPSASGYAASKFAMAGFFDSLRIEMRRYGVSVTMIYPGFVRTNVRRMSVGADGKPSARDFPEGARIMSAETAARVMARAIRRRRRELVMPPKGTFMYPIGNLLEMVKVLAPGIIDRIAVNTIKQGF